MPPMLDDLNDVALAVDHVRDTLDLLRRAVKVMDASQVVEVDDVAELVDLVLVVPPDAPCGRPGPEPPPADQDCFDPARWRRGEFRVGELVMILDYAVRWCDRIGRDLGDSFLRPEPPPA